MKKIVNFFVAFVLVFNFSFNTSIFAAATSAPHFFISRVNATDGAEFIEIYNNSSNDVEVSSLKIRQGVSGREIFSKDNFVFRGESYFLIRQSGSGDAHGFFEGNQIGQKAILRVILNDEVVAYLCAESAKSGQCEKAGVTKNSTDLKGSGVAVNFFEIPTQKTTRDKYEFKLLSDKEVDAEPMADDFSVEGVVQIEGGSVEDEENEEVENLNPEVKEKDATTDNENANDIADGDIFDDESPKKDETGDVVDEVEDEPTSATSGNNTLKEDEVQDADSVVEESVDPEDNIEVDDGDEVEDSDVSAVDQGGEDDVVSVDSEREDPLQTPSKENTESDSGNSEQSRDDLIPVAPLKCHGLKFSEILVNSAEGFFEIVNESNDNISLAGCGVRYKNAKRIFDLPEVELATGEILAIKFSDTNLKPAKTTAGEFYILENNQEIDTIKYEKTAQNVAVIRVGDEVRETYQPTFGAANVLKIEKDCNLGYAFDFETKKCSKMKVEALPSEKTCAEGYFVNPETGRCKKVPVEKEKKAAVKTSSSKTLAECKIGYERNPDTNRCRKIQSGSGVGSTQTPCKEGYYRSEETNRCRKIATADNSSSLKPCAEGYYRHPETNRCRKISATASGELTPCKDGYERNPDTNRCRKIVKNEGASDSVAEILEAEKNFTGWWMVALVAAGAALLAIWEFRFEIFAIFRRGE